MGGLNTSIWMRLGYVKEKEVFMRERIFKEAFALQDETVAHRRYLHEHAEVGLDLPMTMAYIRKTLSAVGIDAMPCGKGLVAEVGRGERLILLRADADALPMREESGETFASKENAAHTCGHDLHAAALLSAAKILKKREASLDRRVKLVFQPAEEPLLGCRNMMENGLITEKPSAAFALHVGAGNIPVGRVLYNAGGVMMLSCDRFRIVLKGKGGHAAYPQLARDPLAVAVKLYAAFESLMAKEKAPDRCAVLSIGKLSAGEADNVICEMAVMEGSLRTDNRDLQTKLLARIQELVDGYASLYGVEADFELFAHLPPLVCDKALTERMVEILEGEELTFIPDIQASASEDFALIAAEVPSCYLYFTAGFEDARGAYTAHNSRVVFDERVLAYGAAAYTMAGLTL